MRFMTRLVMAALVIGATACGDSSGLDDDVDGTYTLRTVNGSQLPFIVEEDGTSRAEIVSSTLIIHDNNTWSETTTVRLTQGTSITTFTDTFTGTYTLNGNSVVLTDSEGDSLTATFSGSDTLTSTEQGFTFVYRK
jgi:hypothetical protein